MTFEVSSRLVATATALAGFALAVIAGLAAGNPSSTVLFNAILCMFVCHVVGSLIGSITERTVREHVASLKSRRAGDPVGTPGAPA